ncbi:MAG: hypothetical protein AAFW46_18205 [Pseudomonadota bacterium]
MAYTCGFCGARTPSKLGPCIACRSQGEDRLRADPEQRPRRRTGSAFGATLVLLGVLGAAILQDAMERRADASVGPAETAGAGAEWAGDGLAEAPPQPFKVAPTPATLRFDSGAAAARSEAELDARREATFQQALGCERAECLAEQAKEEWFASMRANCGRRDWVWLREVAARYGSEYVAFSADEKPGPLPWVANPASAREFFKKDTFCDWAAFHCWALERGTALPQRWPNRPAELWSVQLCRPK